MPSETQPPELPMPLERKTQKIFAGAADPGSIAIFGSLASSPIILNSQENPTPSEDENTGENAGASEIFTNDPEKIQNEAYEKGWGAAVVSDDSPALEDMNALFYLITRQIAYLFEKGIPEWDADTTYHKGSMCSVPGSGKIYIAKNPGTLGTPEVDTANWLEFGSDKATVAELVAGLAQKADQSDMNHVEERLNSIEEQALVAEIAATYAALQALNKSKFTANDYVKVLQDETHEGKASFYQLSVNKMSWGWKYSEEPDGFPLEGDQASILNPKSGQLVLEGAEGESSLTMDASAQMIGRDSVDIQSLEGKVTLTANNARLIVGEGRINISGHDGNIKLTGINAGTESNDAVNKHQLNTVEAKAETAMELAHTKLEAVSHDATLSGNGTPAAPLSAAPLLTLVADDATAEAMSLLYPDRYFASPE